MSLATDESIKAVLRNWPTTMGILMFEELGLYTQPEAKFYIDLKEYIGAPKQTFTINSYHSISCYMLDRDERVNSFNFVK